MRTRSIAGQLAIDFTNPPDQESAGSRSSCEVADLIPAATRVATGYHGAVDEYGEAVGPNHIALKKSTAQAQPVVACGVDTMDLNWTLRPAPAGAGGICKACDEAMRGCVRSLAEAQPSAADAVTRPSAVSESIVESETPRLENFFWEKLPADVDVVRTGNSYIATCPDGRRGLVNWSSYDAEQATRFLDAAADRTQEAGRLLEPASVASAVIDRPAPTFAMARIPGDIAAILSQSHMTERTLTLPGQLDKDLYRRTADVLAKAGGKWSRIQGCHVFARDPRILFAFSDNGDARVAHVQKTYQSFYTPAELATQMVAKAGVVEKCAPRILEPSCGDGRIIKAILEQTTSAARITGYDIDPLAIEKARGLDHQRLDVYERDFLSVQAEQNYDAVILNPPFTRGADMAHVLHAIRHAKPVWGSVVAITSTSWQDRQTTAAKRFREMMDYQHAGIERIRAGTFGASGTDIETIMIHIPTVRACS